MTNSSPPQSGLKGLLASATKFEQGMDRRTYLLGAGAGVAATLSGCMGVLGGEENKYGAHEDVVLDTPDRYDSLKESSEHFARPIHGEKFPEVTLPAPLQGRDVTTTEFVGERHVLMTFIYTRCQTVCPTLTANMVRVQATAAEEGFGDDFAFMPTTFDPEYDTGDRLIAFLEEYDADLDAGNMFPLRPESNERVDAVVTDTFGEEISRPEDREAREEDGGDHEGDGGEMDHYNIIHQPGSYILANAAGYVERGYLSGQPNPGTLLDDVETLVERW